MDQCFEATVPYDKVSLSPSCGCIFPLNDGRLIWVWGSGSAQEPLQPLRANYSSDGGRSWTDPVPLKLQGDGELTAVIGPSLIRMSSGELGMSVRSAFHIGDPNWDWSAPYLFHVSRDEGQTWSDGVEINPQTAHTNREDSAVDAIIQLSDGRLVLPFQKIVGPSPTVEEPNNCTRFGSIFGNCRSYNINVCYVYYSDSLGQTWQRSRNEVFATVDRGLSGCYAMCEPHVAELSDGRLLMVAQTSLGQLFRSYSLDRGQTWQEAEPTGLVVRRSPLCLKRIPETNDLLVIWSQVSPWEDMQGLFRHRLSCAVSKDGGSSWQHHKNLASLDDQSRLEPDCLQYCVLGKAIRQPVDRQRYHRAPGPLRNDHPCCTFHDGTAVISYGQRMLGDPAVIEKTYGMDFLEVCKKYDFKPGTNRRIYSNNKIHVVPIEWLYS